MSDVLAEQYAEAVCRRAGEVVTELSQASPLDPTLLRSTKTILKSLCRDGKAIHIPLLLLSTCETMY